MPPNIVKLAHAETKRPMLKDTRRPFTIELVLGVKFWDNGKIMDQWKQFYENPDDASVKDKGLNRLPDVLEKREKTNDNSRSAFSALASKQYMVLDMDLEILRIIGMENILACSMPN